MLNSEHKYCTSCGDELSGYHQALDRSKCRKCY